MKYYLDQAGVVSLARHLTDAQKSVFATKAEVGTPLVAATAADMTDETKIYVYVGSETGYTAGNWYYYDGSAWQSGGIYNSTAFESDTSLTVPGAAADAKVTGDDIREFNEILSLHDNIPFAWSVAETGYSISYDTGELQAGSAYRVTSYINCSMYKYVSYKRYTNQYSSTAASVAFYNASGVYLEGIKPVTQYTERTYVDYTAEIPADAATMRFTIIADSYGAFSANGTSKLLAAIGTPSASLAVLNPNAATGDEVREINSDAGAEEEQR